MNKIGLIYRNEVRQLLRNPYATLPFVLQLICFGYVIFSYESQSIHYEEIASAYYNNFQWIMMLILLLAGLMSVYMASKDRDSEFEHVVITYRVENTHWITGKWLVMQTYGLCFTIITLLIQGIWFVRGSMGWEEWTRHLFYVFLQMEGAIFLLVSFGFLFGVLIKNMMAYMCIIALLGIAFLSQVNSYGFAFVNPRLNLLTPYDSMFIATPYKSIWGINDVFADAIIHQLGVFLVSMIVMIAAILLFRSHRILNFERKMLVTPIIILLVPVLIVSGIRYSSYDKALEQYIDTINTYVPSDEEGFSFYRNLTDRPKYPFSLDHSVLNVGFPSENIINVQNELSITYHGDKPTKDLSLTLHHQLQISACSSDMQMTCEREKDWIHIQLEDELKPNERLQLKLNYEGKVQQYRADGLQQHSFVEADRIYLPKEAGWYPLIGKRSLAGVQEDPRYVKYRLINGGLGEDFPTSYVVRLMDEVSDVPIALTIPQSADGSYVGTSEYGLSLIGGNLEEVQVNGTRIVGHPEVLKGARKTAGIYMKQWTHLEDWLEMPMKPDVIYMMDNYYSRMTVNTPSVAFIAWDYYDLKYVDPSVMAYQLDDLFPENPSMGEDADILQHALTWELMKHMGVETEYQEFGDWYDKQLSSEKRSLVGFRIDLINRYDEMGDEDFRQAVKYLYKEYSGLVNKLEFSLETALLTYEGKRTL